MLNTTFYDKNGKATPKAAKAYAKAHKVINKLFKEIAKDYDNDMTYLLITDAVYMQKIYANLMDTFGMDCTPGKKSK